MVSEKKFLLREYAKKKKSARQIAKETDCSHSTVLYYLCKFNIALRHTPFPNQITGQIAFGYKAVNGKLRQNLNEQKVIKKMSDFRSEGFSYRKIATILNALNVPTKGQHSKWHATTVMKILKSFS